MSKELEKVTGWFFTHYDCPSCNEVIETEGDTRGETIECDVCGKKFKGE